MGIPTWVPGEVLASADVNSWFVPLAAVKGSDQSVTSSTTVVGDNDLILTVPAAATYVFQCYLDYEGGTQGSADLKIQWLVPSGAILRYQPIGIGTNGGMGFGLTDSAGASPSFGTNGAAALIGLTLNGVLIVSSTPGTVQLKWAQSTSSGTATILHTGSWLTLRRIA